MLKLKRDRIFILFEIPKKSQFSQKKNGIGQFCFSLTIHKLEYNCAAINSVNSVHAGVSLYHCYVKSCSFLFFKAFYFP